MAIQKILIAVDDSRHADHAAEFGFEIARLCDAEVGLVNIIEPIIMPAGSDSITGISTEVSMVDEPEMVRIQKEAAENTVRRIQGQYAEKIKITNFTEYGLTADGILKCGTEFGADMIVIGTHGRTGIDRLFMGSIAENVVRRSKVPVLVVPLGESDSR
jgi:nucleotide-binding universal stress UspA family protein